MSRYVRIALVVGILGLFLGVGIPLSPEGNSPTFADRHPGWPARCNHLAENLGLISCLANSEARLDGTELIETVTDHINLTTFPFGYLFVVSLTLFLLLAVILM